MTMRRLYKSEHDRKISGVCAGIADYFGLDPTVIRVGWLLLSLFTAGFPGILAYIICAVVLPNESQVV